MNRAAPLMVVVMLASALQGCGMRPLYGSGGESGAVVAELSAIAIPAPRNRLDQLIRNDLVSSIRPAGTAAEDRYTLVLETQFREDRTIEAKSTDTLRQAVRVNVAFNLVERGSGASVYAGKTFAQVSYDETGESFADLQARTTAIERAAREVAADIRTRLAAHFAAKG